jgi:hypothetical protein
MNGILVTLLKYIALIGLGIIQATIIIVITGVSIAALISLDGESVYLTSRFFDTDAKFTTYNYNAVLFLLVIINLVIAVSLATLNANLKELNKTVSEALNSPIKVLPVRTESKDS